MYRRMVAGTELDPGDTWQERLRRANHGLRKALLAYRDGAKVFSGSRFTGTDHAAQMEETLRLFTAAGFTLGQAVRATSSTYAYTIGSVIEEQGVQPLPDERREGYDVAERARLLAEFPLSARAARRSSTITASISRKGWRSSSRESGRDTAFPEIRQPIHREFTGEVPPAPSAASASAAPRPPCSTPTPAPASP